MQFSPGVQQGRETAKEEGTNVQQGREKAKEEDTNVQQNKNEQEDCMKI